jgi:uncharacterized protein YbcI
LGAIVEKTEENLALRRRGSPVTVGAPRSATMATEPLTDERGLILAEISKSVVRIHKRSYGKGPVRARSHLSRDLLTVVLEGGFTRAEQMLHRHGHSQQVIESRMTLARTIENELCAAVETILYRSVRSFMSAPDPANDLQVEVFVLRPQGSEELTAADGRAAGLDGARPPVDDGR